MSNSGPIKPQNEVTLGGVRFDSNETSGYGKIPTPLKNAGYFIDFKDGTRVEYQNTQPASSIWNETAGSKEIQCDEYGDGKFHLYVDGVDHVNINSNARIVTTINCQDANMTLNNEKGCSVYSYGNKNVSIESSTGNDDISVMGNTESFSINTGDGNDSVTIFGGEELSHSSKEGIVTMAGDGELTVLKSFTYSNYNEADAILHNSNKFQETEVTITSTAKIKGKGTHNVRQTPEEAFDKTKKTVVREYEIDEFGFIEDGTVISEKTEKL